MQTSRFHVVASMIGVIAVVALLALAYDNAHKGEEEAQTSLIQEYLDDDSAELQAIKKQQAELALKEKRLMAKLAAKKVASKQDDKIAKLKAELAAAEAAKKGGSDSTDSDSSDSDSSDKSSSDAADQSTVQSLVTANDFKKLPEKVAKTADTHIAKEAGLKPMGWMGSKEEIDDTLRKYGCDPTSFVCKGSPAQKKIIAKKLQELQATLLGDGKQVQAYGWKEEHALPPAPKM